MDVSIVAYPFIFLAIYFEVFLLLTFLSSPAREGRARGQGTYTPSVAMIVPCYNEETTIGETIESLLALSYPKEKLNIILVDDGSIDGTREVMDRYVKTPMVTIIHKENGGKHTALNAGIAAAKDAELIGCLDADSFVEKNALLEIVPCFQNERVAAATSAMSIHRPKNLLEHMQNAEYILGIALRHILASVNGLYVTPGPFSLYRKDTIVALGGFRRGHDTEDMEMALRIQQAGFVIENAPRARVFTKAPKTVGKLIKQRTRWTTGFLRNVLGEYRFMVLNPRYKTLGLLVLPLAFSAVFGGLMLFFLAVYQILSDVVRIVSTTSGVPLSYTLLPRISFEWFYLPATALVGLALVALVGSVAFMVLGRNISQTPSRIGSGIIAYLALYALIAPFWLMRSVADVACGLHRSWR
jgi:cellulose synthase/poly-beta-1,6-N-acetylglucosamine synthase-like glycosyltransferase